MSKAQSKNILNTNRKAHHRYHILETVEAGIVLTGSEVKSAKTGGLNLSDSYAVLKNGEAWLLNCHIAPYAYDALGMRQAEPTRSRKLLLKKQEIAKMMSKAQAKGWTVIPVEVYVNEKGLVKVLLGLAQGKSGPDRRDDIKRKDLERELGRKYKLH
ncbi:MAG: SsrA-binding protein SmpB [Elusimicrobia bacterium]|nr:SsrA-binding protein SmpB [Elusimicrobiota bacterium]